MGYVKTGLAGPDKSSFMAKAILPGASVSEEQAAVSNEEAAFLASLPRCSVNGQPSALYLYTYKNGTKACVSDPLGVRRLETTGTLATATMPLYNADGTIRQGYLDMLLKAQGSPGNQVAAQKAGVDWYPPYAVGKHDHTHNVVEPSEFLGARLTMLQSLHKTFPPESVAAARGTAQELGIKNILAFAAHNVATFTIPKQREARASGEGVREHRPSFCDTLGLPPAYNACCRSALKSGMGFEQYTELLEKGDPQVLSCFAQADAAARKRKLLLAAGAVGAVVLGAALLKKGKR